MSTGLDPIGAGAQRLVRNMLLMSVPMHVERLSDGSLSLGDAENWLARGAGAVLLDLPRG